MPSSRSRDIVRHKKRARGAFQAAIDAADQIGLAVIATSATIIAVFIRASFMGGIIGQFFKQFGLTVAAAVFFSLLRGAIADAGDRRVTTYTEVRHRRPPRRRGRTDHDG